MKILNISLCLVLLVLTSILDVETDLKLFMSGLWSFIGLFWVFSKKPIKRDKYVR